MFGDGGEEEELCGGVVGLLFEEEVEEGDCGVEEEAVADEDPL